MSDETKEFISSEVKTILINMFEMFKKERDNNALEMPLNNPIERIHNYTGLPKSRILALCNMKSLIFPSKVVDEIPLNLMTSITSALLPFYRNKQVPQPQEVYDIVKVTCINTPNTIDGFQNTLIALGYEYKKLNKDSRYLLVENPKLTFERNLFLNRMKKRRAMTKKIYYFDERIITPLSNFKKPLAACTEPSKSSTFIADGIILFHVVSNNGLNNSLYSNSLSQADFSKWLCDIVIPSLDPNSVLVMENSWLHGSLLTLRITRYHSKAVMMGVLKQNNIPCTENMSKAELYSLIEKSACLKSHCGLDQILQAHGHELILLPTNYQKLSPTENLWIHIKAKLLQDLTKKSDIEIKNIIQTLIDDISLTQWNMMFKNIIALEEHILSLDSKVEAALDTNYTFLNNPEEILMNNPIYFHE